MHDSPFLLPPPMPGSRRTAAILLLFRREPETRQLLLRADGEGNLERPWLGLVEAGTRGAKPSSGGLPILLGLSQWAHPCPSSKDGLWLMCEVSPKGAWETPMFVAALFTRARRWKHPSRPLMNGEVTCDLCIQCAIQPQIGRKFYRSHNADEP